MHVVPLRELSSQNDESFQYTVFDAPPSEYFVPEGIHAPADAENANSELQANFIAPRRAMPPRRSLTVFRNCYVLPNAPVVTSSGNVISESCFPYSSPWLTQMFSPWLTEETDGTVRARLDKIQRCDQKVIYVREHGEHGFFHWMHSVLPRMAILKENRFSKSYALLYQCEQPFQREGFAMTGLSEWPLVAPNPTCAQFFPELIFPSPLVERGDFWARSLEVGAFYDSLPATSMPQLKHVYITRAGGEARRITNETEVMRLLETFGFSIIDCNKLSFGEQLGLIRQCSFLAGAHGAGLSHAVAMRPGSCLLEILHPRRFWATYRAISARRGVRYGFVVGNEPGVETLGDAFGFSVDVEKLKYVLGELLLRARVDPTSVGDKPYDRSFS